MFWAILSVVLQFSFYSLVDPSDIEYHVFIWCIGVSIWGLLWCQFLRECNRQLLCFNHLELESSLLMFSLWVWMTCILF